MTADILIVDDEEDIRHLIQGILEDEGYITRAAPGAASAFDQIAKKAPDLIILDVWLQGSEKDGLQILQSVKKDHPHIPVIMISGHGTIETAVSAIKDGAYDFIEKPFKTDRLLTMMTRALEQSALKRENRALRQRADVTPDTIGHSAAGGELKQNIEKLAAASSRVMIMGEAGSGKESVARMIHAASSRAGEPFVILNCTHLNSQNFEEDMFGIAGQGGRPGKLEQAGGGTILLYEVTDIPPDMQGRIVKMLQEQSFTPRGGKDPVKMNARVLSSTRKDIHHEIKQGNFREDLFYRLNVVSLIVPPLRERVQDIPALAQSFIDKSVRETGRGSLTLAPSAITALQAYLWPGNIRQLRNEMERAVIMCGDGETLIERHHLSGDIIGEYALTTGEDKAGEDYLSMPLREAREAFERKYLQPQLIRFEGSVSDTSRFIGMERSALHRKLKSLGLNGHDKQDAGEDDTLDDARKIA